MKHIIFLITLSWLLLTAYGQNVQESCQNCYPQEVVKLRKEKMYDKTKWFIYSTCCSNKLKFTKSYKGLRKTVTFGELPLKFSDLTIKGDTTEIHFYFFYKNSRVDNELVYNYPTWGCVFIGESDKIIKIASIGDIRYNSFDCHETSTCPDMYELVNISDVKKYLTKHKNKLDPWFRQEAIKRGVIK